MKISIVVSRTFLLMRAMLALIDSCKIATVLVEDLLYFHCSVAAVARADRITFLAIRGDSPAAGGDIVRNEIRIASAIVDDGLVGLSSVRVGVEDVLAGLSGDRGRLHCRPVGSAAAGIEGRERFCDSRADGCEDRNQHDGRRFHCVFPWLG